MALKNVSQIILIILLWLSLLFLLFHEFFYNFKSKIIINQKHISATSTLSYSSTPSHHHLQPLISRKVLARQFDLSPFVRHYQDQQQQNRRTKRSDHGHENKRERPELPAGDDQGEIDPRYGVEKRRVPTGPNPLHH